jgi:hypothetical protein
MVPEVIVEWLEHRTGVDPQPGTLAHELADQVLHLGYGRRVGRHRHSCRCGVIDSVALEEGRWTAKGRYGVAGGGLGQTAIELGDNGRLLSIRFVTG